MNGDQLLNMSSPYIPCLTYLCVVIEDGGCRLKSTKVIESGKGEGSDFSVRVFLF